MGRETRWSKEVRRWLVVRRRRRRGRSTGSKGWLAVLARGLISLFLVFGTVRPVRAGAFIFADEVNGANVITHPTGYTGAGGDVIVTVGINPASAHANEMEISVRNIIDTFNRLTPTTGNLLFGSDNNIPPGQVDFESTALHEVGHCLGLGHPNLSTESGLMGADQNYTKSTRGINNNFNLNAGGDGLRGSGDDLRGDDQNLHWFRRSNNNPFTIAGTVDSTTYSRSLMDLPLGQSFAANGDRDVAASFGVPNTEAVMQQGAFVDEAQRELAHDDVATLLYGMSGLDEIAGTADDYHVVLSFAGMTNAANIVLSFDDTQAGFAACQVGGAFISGTDHTRITSANAFFNTGFFWFFNDKLNSDLQVRFGSGSGGGGPLLASGVESSGLSRGAAFQLFNTSGALQTTQFALNPDFRSDLALLLSNFDADAADEVLVGGRETSGLARGSAYQLFDTDGTFKFTRFVLNPDFSNVSFSPLNVGSNGVLVCGQEISGLSRGPAHQAFDASGNLLRTQFVLNPDFTAGYSCMGTNLDGVAGDEVIVGGLEITGLGRGPGFQVFGSDGSLRLTRFVLNPDFRETKFVVLDVGGSKDIVVSGRETTGLGRGPAYQVFDFSGNFILTRFVLNPDFAQFQVFGANTTNGVSGEEIVTGGLETSGLARGPVFQLWDKNGNLLLTRFVLNPDFTDVTFSKIDINNDGMEEILVVGRETKGLARGAAFQLFDGSGNLLVTQFVLNADFTNLKVFPVDQDGDGDKEIGIGGIETKGLLRGPAYQIFESNGTLVQTIFVLNPDF